MSLYHLYCLCDFAPIFMHQQLTTPSIADINQETTEAIIVSFLNYYAEKKNLPLSLYCSDLHEKGSILSSGNLDKNQKDISQVRSCISTFVEDDYLSLINNKYRTHTGSNNYIYVSSKNVDLILKNFIKEYVKYTPLDTK